MRFADTQGWGYAQFDYVLATDKFTPNGSRSNCRNVMGEIERHDADVRCVDGIDVDALKVKKIDGRSL